MLSKDILNQLNESKNLPAFRVGDSVKVHVKIKEGEKERIQIFEGVVIKKRGGNSKGASFTVRKVSYGIGVERVFPFESMAIDKVELVKKGKVRRARLFYLRNRVGKNAQIAEQENQSPIQNEKAGVNENVAMPQVKAVASVAS